MDATACSQPQLGFKHTSLVALINNRQWQFSFLPKLRERKCKLQAPTYDFLPPVTSVADCAINLEKLSANGQFCC